MKTEAALELIRESYRTWSAHHFTAFYFDALARQRDLLEHSIVNCKTSEELLILKGKIEAINDVMLLPRREFQDHVRRLEKEGGSDQTEDRTGPFGFTRDGEAEAEFFHPGLPRKCFRTLPSMPGRGDKYRRGKGGSNGNDMEGAE